VAGGAQGAIRGVQLGVRPVRGVFVSVCACVCAGGDMWGLPGVRPVRGVCVCVCVCV